MKPLQCRPQCTVHLDELLLTRDPWLSASPFGGRLAGRVSAPPFAGAAWRCSAPSHCGSQQERISGAHQATPLKRHPSHREPGPPGETRWADSPRRVRPSWGRFRRSQRLSPQEASMARDHSKPAHAQPMGVPAQAGLGCGTVLGPPPALSLGAPAWLCSVAACTRPCSPGSHENTKHNKKRHTGESCPRDSLFYCRRMIPSLFRVSTAQELKTSKAGDQNRWACT